MDGESDAKAFAFLKDKVLTAGETIQWTGRPNPKNMGRVIESFPDIFGVVVLVFATVWIAIIIASWDDPGHSIGVELFLLLMGLFMVSLALWLLASPFRHRAKARQMYYAITDQRVIILDAKRGGFTSTSLYPRDITGYELAGRPDGTGDIVLSRAEGLSGGLWGITDAKAANEAVSQLLQA